MAACLVKKFPATQNASGKQLIVDEKAVMAFRDTFLSCNVFLFLLKSDYSQTQCGVQIDTQTNRNLRGLK